MEWSQMQHTQFQHSPKQAKADPQGAATSEPAPAKVFHLEDIPVSQQAQIETQKDLDEVLALHARWIQGVFDLETFVPHGRAQLCGLDLRPFTLRGRDLSGANLSYACLQEMDLTGVNFTTANLTGANLALAQLGGAKLRGAKLKDTDLRGVDLSLTEIAGADLSHAVLKSETDAAPLNPPPSSQEF